MEIYSTTKGGFILHHSKLLNLFQDLFQLYGKHFKSTKGKRDINLNLTEYINHMKNKKYKNKIRRYALQHPVKNQKIFNRIGFKTHTDILMRLEIGDRYEI